MRLRMETAEIYVPDDTPVKDALARTTHLGIGAHADDLEILAWDGIAQCYERADRWFTGVVVTDGADSPRDGAYKHHTDEAMCAVRREEQKKAAVLGRYAAVALLDYPSAALRSASDRRPVEDIGHLIETAQPEVVYTHNLADKHDTHVAVALRTIEAVRSIEASKRPKRVLGCEVWRDLDWLVDADKVALDCSTYEDLQRALLGVFESQIAGGKRYDLATMGRRRAHATYHDSYATDAATGLIFAMDLTPLVENDAADTHAFLQAHIDRLARDVAARLKKLR
ncbi:MAG: PIG-L family deacetylase [Verrucomicrobia bacterium]|nr:PIG-L family deacetylase [Verrucomicrobiota bacterium]